MFKSVQYLASKRYTSSAESISPTSGPFVQPLATLLVTEVHAKATKLFGILTS